MAPRILINWSKTLESPVEKLHLDMALNRSINLFNDNDN